MDKDLKTVFSELKKDLTALVTLKLQIFKLEMYEKTSVVASLVIFGLILMLLVSFVLLFLFLALGLFLGQYFGSYGIGMLLVTLIYIIIFAVLIWKKRSVQMFLANIFVEQLTENGDLDESEEKQNERTQ